MKTSKVYHAITNELQTMRMHTFNQAIQRSHFPVLVKSDHIPPFPALPVFPKEPFLHDHVGVQPEISSSLEQPVLLSIRVELAVVAVALCCKLVELSDV